MRDDELRALERASLEAPGDRVAQGRWTSALKRQGEFLPVRYAPMTFAVWSWLPSVRVPGRGFMSLLVYERHVIGGRDEIVTEPMVGEPAEETEVTRWLGFFPQLPVAGSRPTRGVPSFAGIFGVLERTQTTLEAQLATHEAFARAGRMAGEHWERLVAQVLEGNGIAYDGVSMFSQTHGRPLSNDFTSYASRHGDSAEDLLRRLQAERDTARRLGIPTLPRR